MDRAITLHVALLASAVLSAQDSLITVKLKRDTIGVDQRLSVEWIVRAAADSFSIPAFVLPWTVDRGPSKGRGMEMKNGLTTYSTSVCYVLHATQPGTASLPVVRARVNGVWHSSPPVSVVVTVEQVPDSVLNPGKFVPVTGFQPILVMLSANSSLINAHDPQGKGLMHNPTTSETASLYKSFQKVLGTPAEPLTGITELTATLGKTGGSVGMKADGGRRSFELTPEQAKKLEAAVQKILKKY